jgi:hypothetical protein
MSYFLVFDTEEIANQTMAEIKILIHNRDWDTPNYNVYVDKWWAESPQDQTPPRFPQTWDLCAEFRQDLEETWFQNPNPEDPPEYP